jgi:predicted NAD/FAD-dependent oxidoreductase
MQGCFALMLGFSVPLSLDFDAAHVTQSDISWIAVNSHKPERKSEFSLLVHSSADYADAHIEDDPQSVTQHLVNELSRVISQKLETPVHQALHRWRYASNQYRKAAEQVYVDHDRKLAACGDWCEGGRVEGAFTSAFRLVSALEKEGI